MWNTAHRSTSAEMTSPPVPSLGMRTQRVGYSKPHRNGKAYPFLSMSSE